MTVLKSLVVYAMLCSLSMVCKFTILNISGKNVYNQWNLSIAQKVLYSGKMVLLNSSLGEPKMVLLWLYCENLLLEPSFVRVYFNGLTYTFLLCMSM